MYAANALETIQKIDKILNIINALMKSICIPKKNYITLHKMFHPGNGQCIYSLTNFLSEKIELYFKLQILVIFLIYCSNVSKNEGKY